MQCKMRYTDGIMCGRMTIFTIDEVHDIIECIESNAPLNTMPDWPARLSDAFPQDIVPIMLPSESLALQARMLTWGYPVSWQQGPVFNTRIESALAGNALWRDSLANRRCIIPVARFFEPHTTEKERSQRSGRMVKRSYVFNTPNCPVTLLAGVFEDDHFSIVTTEPNKDVAPIHNRMPLVLAQSEIPLWLSPDFAKLADRSSIRLATRPEHNDAPAQQSLF